VYPEAILIIGILMDRLSKDQTKRKKREPTEFHLGTRSASDRQKSDWL
jgi:hypothetical protein